MNGSLTGAAANRIANAVLHFFAFEFTKVKKNQEYLDCLIRMQSEVEENGIVHKSGSMREA